MTFYSYMQEITNGNFIVLASSLFVGAAAITGMFIWRKRDDKRLLLEQELKDLNDPKSKRRTQAEIPTETAYIEVKKYDPLRTGKSRLSLNYWINIFKERRHPDKVVLINMELLNGFHLQFLVKEKEGGFSYRKCSYVFDNELKYFNISAKNWCYDFHESFTLPIRRRIPLADIKSTLEQPGLSEVEYMTNPSTLSRFIISKIAEGIMKGQAIDKYLRQFGLYLLVIMIVSLIHFIMFVYASGMLKNIKLPF